MPSKAAIRKTLVVAIGEDDPVPPEVVEDLPLLQALVTSPRASATATIRNGFLIGSSSGDAARPDPAGELRGVRRGRASLLDGGRDVVPVERDRLPHRVGG